MFISIMSIVCSAFGMLLRTEQESKQYWLLARHAEDLGVVGGPVALHNQFDIPSVCCLREQMTGLPALARPGHR